MPNVSQMIRTIAKQNNTQQYIIEKDFALSYLLKAISEIDELGCNLVLKGGTALRKLYFADYRFSEDLDYSTRKIAPVHNFDTLFEKIVERLEIGLHERGPFHVYSEPLILKQPHPSEQKAGVIHVQFPNQRQAFCRLKVEITVDEPIITTIETRSVLHGFPEEFVAQIPVYSLTEITAEKMRALLQSKAKLKEKGWGASRVCRDYYDLWNLLQVPGLITPNLIDILKQKCLIRHVSFTDHTDFISSELFDTADVEWMQQIIPFVPESPPASEILPEVKALITSIWE
ncbi:MAG: nucleotidyl transferase AbiEii/AbiGii toxin family protein [Chloroflexota bacterium]